MKSTDIYFAADDAHAFLPWIIGIMALLAALLLCLGVTVGSWASDHSDHYANSFTINVPASAEHAEDKLAELTKALQKNNAIESVTPVSQKELRSMLKPWLGSSADADSGALPLPLVLDVTLKAGSAIDYNRLQAQLRIIAPEVQMDSHEAWVANFLRFSAGLRTVMEALATFIIGGLALMISFTSRAALKLHSRTITLLHSIGAEDGYIAQQFQWEAFMVSLRGTLPACILAGVAYRAGGSYMASLNSPSLPSFTFETAHLVMLCVLPLVCGVIAVIAARVSVIRQLQRVL